MLAVRVCVAVMVVVAQLMCDWEIVVVVVVLTPLHGILVWVFNG